MKRDDVNWRKSVESVWNSMQIENKMEKREGEN